MSAERIILMYISEVSGHHGATIAIEKAIKILSPDTEVLNINGFNYTNPISEKIINRLYMGIIKRTPQIWDYLYDNPSVAKTDPQNSAIRCSNVWARSPSSNRRERMTWRREAKSAPGSFG